jgi:AraC family transcriptional activator of mtrCDE
MTQRIKPLDDALSGLAPLLRVRPELQDFCRFGGGWSAPHEAEKPGWAYFHIVTGGTCRLERLGREFLTLETGDVLLLPHGDGHTLRARSTAPAGRQTIDYVNALRFRTSIGVETDTELICGRLHFELAPENLLIAALPDLIVLRLGGRADRLSMLMSAIRDELDGSRPGSAAIAADLASALFVMMLRDHLEGAPQAAGLLALLGQRMTALAVLAMLREPARDWTLDELANIAAASRATLVRAFRKAAEIAPLAFLTELRLGLAQQRLLSGHDPIGQIADEVGYHSEAALSRAFQRHFGVRPGSLRKSVPAERQASGAADDALRVETP